jgi:hypothetical protein
VAFVRGRRRHPRRGEYEQLRAQASFIISSTRPRCAGFSASHCASTTTGSRRSGSAVSRTAGQQHDLAAFFQPGVLPDPAGQAGRSVVQVDVPASAQPQERIAHHATGDGEGTGGTGQSVGYARAAALLGNPPRTASPRPAARRTAQQLHGLPERRTSAIHSAI